eukprot:441084_1
MKDCKDIVLAGTFSENKYLRKTIKTYFSEYRVHAMARPCVAVVEGAAIYGLKWDACFTYASQSVGLQITRDYEAKIDDEKMKRYDDASSKYVIDCGLETFVEEGKIKWFKPWKAKQTEKK